MNVVAVVGPSIVTEVTCALASFASGEPSIAAIVFTNWLPFLSSETRVADDVEPSKNACQFWVIAAFVSDGRAPMAATEDEELVPPPELLPLPPQPEARASSEAATANPTRGVRGKRIRINEPARSAEGAAI